MGIYPTTDCLDVNTGRPLTPSDLHFTEAWYERYDGFSGAVQYRLIMAEPLVEIRDDCYCCSCGDHEGSDCDCRNHGWDGRRPCETHAMPGAMGDDGLVPDSVQAYRARHAGECS